MGLAINSAVFEIVIVKVFSDCFIHLNIFTIDLLELQLPNRHYQCFKSVICITLSL